MNRLVIIGNGFDLAHGLKTSYNDFLEWIWHNKLDNSRYKANYDIINSETNCFVENDLFSLSFISYDRLPNEAIKSQYLDKISPWDQLSQDKRRNNLFIEYKSPNIIFAELLYRKSSNNQWADIEKLFFDLLVKESKTSNRDINILNEDFNVIKHLFEEYLSTITSENIEINNIIKKEIYETNKPQREVHNIEILNFNYTNTFDKYINPTFLKSYFNYGIQEYKRYSIHTNYIHGKLNSETNPIIFGYGDERGDEYKKIELLDNNIFFEHIKSFAYLNTPNYNQLISFIENKEFDVVIIGHSCALTDRTLLNTIFEHKNCTSIKPLYRKRTNNSDNYQDTVRNISRSFDDKKKMRKLIVNKTQTEPIN